MDLSRVHQKWMTEIYCPGLPGSHRFGVPGGWVEVDYRQARFTGGFKNPRHLQVRARPDTCWRILFANVRKKKKHQQCAPARAQIDMPGQEIVGIGMVSGKARVDVPTRIPGLL